MMKVVALAGGVGGAKMASGLAQVLPPEDLTVVVNVGDDFEHPGLNICPDLDTVCYTLAGLANPETGWGRASETFHALQTVAELGGPDWFRLGDRDLGLHLERTRRLRQGELLSQITRDVGRAWGVGPTVLPASDDPLRTWVSTADGDLPFQEYFVHRACQPRVTGFRFAGALGARPAAGVIQALAQAELVVICPSNPWVSIDPILAIPDLRAALAAVPILAVSPIIGGQTVKGPAAKMYAEMGIEPSALAVARHYQSLIQGFVLDVVDKELEEEVRSLGMTTLVTRTLMQDELGRSRLAREVLEFGSSML